VPARPLARPQQRGHEPPLAVKDDNRLVLRDRRDEKRASIRMRNCRRMRDERWA
jgi:hypothetical protein